jgi:hypothetical protein
MEGSEYWQGPARRDHAQWTLHAAQSRSNLGRPSIGVGCDESFQPDDGTLRYSLNGFE